MHTIKCGDVVIDVDEMAIQARDGEITRYIDFREFEDGIRAATGLCHTRVGDACPIFTLGYCTGTAHDFEERHAGGKMPEVSVELDDGITGSLVETTVETMQNLINVFNAALISLTTILPTETADFEIVEHAKDVVAYLLGMLLSQGEMTTGDLMSPTVCAICLKPSEPCGCPDHEPHIVASMHLLRLEKQKREYND